MLQRWRWLGGLGCKPIVLAASLLLALPLAGCSSDEDEVVDDLGGFKLVTGLPEVMAFGAVWSFSPSDVWVTAEGGRVLHFDGSSWEETQLGTTMMMLGAWGFAPNDLWLVGGNQLARYDGSSWTLTTLSDEEPGIEDVVEIWGSAPDDVWVVGSQSTAAHFDGSTWQRYIAAGTDNSVVWGSGPDDVYVSGIFDLAHWNGTEWQELDPGWWSGSAEGIWGFGSDDVWLASGSDELAHLDGASWEIVELDFIAEAVDLWGSGPSDLWGVGTPGGILHYDGSSWTEVAHQEIGSPFLRMFTDVHGSGQGDVWIIGTELGDQGAKPQLYRR
ncbi:MAG: hypothetical protein JRI68_26005 [Deltaproteobacteria bacterium]|nr:hypothetical protein [Deltaproteobacteria bacterium]